MRPGEVVKARARQYRLVEDRDLQSSESRLPQQHQYSQHKEGHGKVTLSRTDTEVIS